MRKTKSFKPVAGDVLEDRTVPSGTGFGTFVTPLPAQDAYAVARAFNTFEQTYLTDVKTILAPKGSTPSNNVGAFNTAVGNAINALNASIKGDLANLPLTGPGLYTTISGETALLQSTLASQATKTPPTGTTNAALRAFNLPSLRTIEATESQAVGQVYNDTATGAITRSTLNTALRSVDTAFQKFRTDYRTAVSNDLLLTTPSNTTKFTSDVQLAFTALQTSVTSAVPAGLPASTATTLAGDLTTLQTRLNGLTSTPTSTSSRFATRFFLAIAEGATYLAEGRIAYDLTSAVQTYNNGLL